MISISAIHWIAGFLEGEGCFRWQANGRGRGGRVHVSASQVQREPLERLARYLGGNVLIQRPGCAKWQTCYAWNLGRAQAVGLMMTIYRLMSPRRREQILSTLTAWRKAPGHGWELRERFHCPYGHPYTKTITTKTCTQRICQVCRRDDQRRFRAKQRVQQGQPLTPLDIETIKRFKT